MDKLKCKSYAPNERGFGEQKPEKIMAYSAKDYAELPDPVRDPIVSNNISNQEFDYTYNNGSISFDDCPKDESSS
jgi:hypothetical protein